MCFGIFRSILHALMLRSILHAFVTEIRAALIKVTVFISRIWPKLIMVSSADKVNGISMSSTTFNWSAGAIFLFWHRFAESELGMASPCFIKGGHFMPFYFFFFSLSVSVSVSVSHSFLSNKRR